MSRATLALLALVLLVPLADAQMVRPVGPGMIIDGEGPVPVVVELIVGEGASKTRAHFPNPWLVVGLDNIVNLTVHNSLAEPLNATFRLNVTGATVSESTIRVEVPARSVVGHPFVLHPDDVGMVLVIAEAEDAFQPSGDPLRSETRLPALALPSMRFVDPPVQVQEDEEFQLMDSFRGSREGLNAYIRIRAGESIVPRMELTNPFESSLPPFRLRLGTPRSSIPPVDVPSLDPGQVYVVEFAEYRPVEAPSGGIYFGGSMGSFELRPLAEVGVGGATLSAGAMQYRIERGAVLEVQPVWATIDVQEGVVIDLFVPREPVLGAPTRIKYNITNLQTTASQGRLVITINTPNGLFYEVQGPESHQISVAVGPGEVVSGAIDFTPRVTGHWQVSTFYRMAEGFSSGSGGSFEVKGPVLITFDRTEQVFARIGEPVEVGLSLLTTETLQDARLRVSAGSTYFRYRDMASTSGSAFRPGFGERLVESRTPTESLGTLRPGGALNTSIEIVGRSSGSYSIVAYVVAEGFAYTSTVPSDSASTSFPRPPGFSGHATALNVAVQPRPVPAGLSLAPLTLGLVFFVGAWTLRTRFVK